MREVWLKTVLDRLYKRMAIALAKNDGKLIDQIRSEEYYLKSKYEKN